MPGEREGCLKMACQDFREHPPVKGICWVWGPTVYLSTFLPSNLPPLQTSQDTLDKTLKPSSNCNFQQTCLSAWWPPRGPADFRAPPLFDFSLLCVFGCSASPKSKSLVSVALRLFDYLGVLQIPSFLHSKMGSHAPYVENSPRLGSLLGAPFGAFGHTT